MYEIVIEVVEYDSGGMGAARRSICGIYRCPDLTNVRKQEGRKKEKSRLVECFL